MNKKFVLPLLSLLVMTSCSNSEIHLNSSSSSNSTSNTSTSVVSNNSTSSSLESNDTSSTNSVSSESPNNTSSTTSNSVSSESPNSTSSTTSNSGSSIESNSTSSNNSNTSINTSISTSTSTSVNPFKYDIGKITTIIDKEDNEPLLPNTKTLSVEEKIVYVSPKGNGDGNRENPMDLKTALSNLHPGNVVILLDGVYSINETITLSNNGTNSNYIYIVAENSSQVRLDFSKQTLDNANRGINLNASFIYMRGIEIFNAGDNGISVSGNYNILERIKLNSNRDTGLQISRSSSTLNDIKNWPHNNLILNCTSFNNQDATGENADGFAAKLTCGYHNVFDGCISYNNSDDGWDLFTKAETGPIGSLTIKNCIAFNNGRTIEGTEYLDGDGNGFKLGGSKIAVDHYVENCIAFNNANHGFTDNSNPGTITLKNCTSYNNSLKNGNKRNIDVDRDGVGNNKIENILSINVNSSNDKFRGIGSHSLVYNNKYYYIGEEGPADETTNKGVEYQGEVTPTLVFEKLPEIAPSCNDDIDKLWRGYKGSIVLGEIFKVKAPFNTLGTNGGTLGADFVNDIDLK